jgi:hypothetical protein
MLRTLLVSSLAVLALAVACNNDAPQPQPCRDIPAGGCPLSNGVACDDPSCVATYACNPDNTWSLAQMCPARDAGPDADAISEASTDAPRALFDANGFDAPPGSFGGSCSPALQDGDCQLGEALACPPGNVDPCCGCEGLFVCGSDGAWRAWGYCDADAGLVYSP